MGMRKNSNISAKMQMTPATISTVRTSFCRAILVAIAPRNIDMLKITLSNT